MLHNVHRNTQKINRYSILNSPFIIPTAIPNKSHSNNPRKNFPTTITAVFTRSPKLSSYRSATFKWVIHFSATLSPLFFPYQTERKKERKNKRERETFQTESNGSRTVERRIHAFVQRIGQPLRSNCLLFAQLSQILYHLSSPGGESGRRKGGR